MYTIIQLPTFHINVFCFDQVSQRCLPLVYHISKMLRSYVPIFVLRTEATHILVTLIPCLTLKELACRVSCICSVFVFMLIYCALHVTLIFIMLSYLLYGLS